MTNKLSQENENFIRSAVKSGRYGSDDEALNEAVRLLRDADDRPENGASLSEDEWEAEFTAWTNSHRTLDRLADDGRETNYAGRGE